MGVENVNIGICDVFYTPKGSTTEVYIGLTKGGVEFSYEPKFHAITVDQYGDTPVDYTLEGEEARVKVPVVESDLQKIDQLMPTGTKFEESGNIKQVGFGSFPTLKLSSLAGTLRLHPISMGADNTNDIIIWKAANTGRLELGFQFNDEQVIQADFVALIDTTKPPGAMLFAFGDSSYIPTGAKNITSFYIVPSTAEVLDGDTMQLEAYVVREGGFASEVTLASDGTVWASSDSLVATISADGLLTAVGTGTVTITATFSGETVIATIKVV